MVKPFASFEERMLRNRYALVRPEVKIHFSLGKIVKRKCKK